MNDLHDTHDSAPVLGTTSATLRKSRSTGLLWGVAAPPHIRIGNRVLYRATDLQAWINLHSVVLHSTKEG